uniref:nuclear pore membrane glycoprotein 210-like n=1 Tax=Oncorhynchus gorbuscha TaxID=8017 RepID=UPI001EAF25D7|nr:nuclear pore membrane glycoprotein 210-like [Oncorhynchus gorbuscha]
MAGVKGSAFSGEQVCARLPETGLYSDQTEPLLRNLQPSAELTVYGPAAVLDSLKVSSSSLSISFQEREVSHGFPSFLKYMVSALDPQAIASVSITSSSTGHTLVIPVTLIHVADPSTTMQAAAPVVTMEGAHFLQRFIDPYQMMFFTIFALLAGSCHFLPGYPGQVD